jgi:hypothetical protein
MGQGTFISVTTFATSHPVRNFLQPIQPYPARSLQLRSVELQNPISLDASQFVSGNHDGESLGNGINEQQRQ